MESMTIFLAQLWGPAVLAVGAGLFISRGHYARIYRELQREPFALLVFGLIGIMAGIWHVQVHNIWGSLPEIIISIFGWGLLLKALLFVVNPKLVDNWGDWVAANKLLPVVSTATVVLGAYLSWVGYFMM